MSLSCPCRHVSYGTWRLTVLRALCRSFDEHSHRTNSFRPERSQPQIRVRKYNTYLPLRSRAKNSAREEDGATQQSSGTEKSDKTNTTKDEHFNPYNAAGRQAIKDLLTELKTVSKTIDYGPKNQVPHNAYKRVQFDSTEDVNAQEDPTTQLAITTRLRKYLSTPGDFLDPIDAQGHQSVDRLVSELVEAGKDMEHGEEGSSAREQTSHTPVSPVLLWVERAAKLRDERKTHPSYHHISGLKNNPWAEILASPIRACQGSGARLPKDLLLDLGYVENRKLNKLYLTPASLADLDALEAEMAAEWAVASRPLRYSDGEAVNPRQPVGEDGNAGQENPEDPNTNFPRGRIQTQSRILSNMTFLQTLTDTITQPKKGSSGSPATRETIPSEVTKLVHHEAREAASTGSHYTLNKHRFDAAVSCQQPGSATSGSAGQRKEFFNLHKLHWQFDVHLRVVHIMQKRILVALKALAEAESAAKNQNQSEMASAAFPIGVPKTGTFDGDELRRWRYVAGTENSTSENEEPGTGSTIKIVPSKSLKQKQAARRIQSSSSSTDQAAETTYQRLGDAEWLPGSIFLHIGPSDISSRLSLCPASKSTLPPLPGSNPLIPPMVAVMDTHRFPVFSLQRLFTYSTTGPMPKTHSLEEELKALIAQHESFQFPQTAWGKDGPSKQWDYLVFVRSMQGPARTLVEEVWRLWRYLGGEKMDVSFFPEDEDVVEGLAGKSQDSSDDNTAGHS